MDTLSYAVMFAKAAVGLWIWSVWSWRLRNETSFRPDGAKNLVQEFQKYGYPMWVLKLTGFFKFLFSGLLLISIIVADTRITIAGAAGMIFLMVVAVGSHVKVKDGLTQNLAALIMLVLSIFILTNVLMDPPADMAAAQNQTTQGFGCACAIVCLCMVVRSFMRGDYNLDNYENLADPLVDA